MGRARAQKCPTHAHQAALGSLRGRLVGRGVLCGLKVLALSKSYVRFLRTEKRQVGCEQTVSRLPYQKTPGWMRKKFRSQIIVCLGKLESQISLLLLSSHRKLTFRRRRLPPPVFVESLTTPPLSVTV
jgi:hypothetical protein